MEIYSDIVMDINVNITVNSGRGDLIDKLLGKILNKVNNMSVQIDDLTAKVAALTTVQGSAILLLQGLKKALDEAIAGGDLSAVQALSDQIGVNTQALADAVVANTPTPVTPPPVAQSR